jgi:prolyl oligopeptidase
VAPRQYPPILIKCGLYDERVNPAHSYKFAAAMQENQRGKAPILLRVENNAGHEGGEHRSNSALEELAFFNFWLGMTSG